MFSLAGMLHCCQAPLHTGSNCICLTTMLVQIIPALERILSLVGADLRAWFAAMPRPQKLLPQKRPQGPNAPREGPAAQHLGPGRAAASSILGTIDRYYLSRHCAVRTAVSHASGRTALLIPAACSDYTSAGKFSSFPFLSMLPALPAGTLYVKQHDDDQCHVVCLATGV